MKKIFLYNLIIFFTFQIFSCSNSDTNTTQETSEDTESNASTKKQTIQISGTILNPIKGEVSLEIMTGNKFSLAQSIDLQGDKFKIEVEVPEPEFYRINLFNKQYIYLVLNKNDIKIEADASQEDIPYVVKGSKDVDFFQAVNNMQNELKLKNDSLAQLLQKGQSRESLIKTFTKFEEIHVKKLTKLIESSEPSVAMYMALSTADPDKYFSLWEKTAKILQKSYPDSKYTKALLARVAQAQATAIGEKAPEINLQTPEGKKVQLSSIKGKYVLVDFWASWCRPCRAENPNVVAVYEKYKDKGLSIYGVSLDQNANAWQQAIKQDNLTWTQVIDAQNQAAKAYSVESIPQNFLIDTEGKIVAKNLRGSQLETKVAELLN